MKYTPKYGGSGEVLSPKNGSPKGKKHKGTEGGKKDPLIKDTQNFSLTAHSGDRLEYESTNQQHGMGVANADGTVTIHGYKIPVGYKKPKDNLTHVAAESLRSLKTESADPRLNLFDRYCSSASHVTQYGAMDFFARNKQQVPSTAEFVSLMENSSNYAFDQLPTNESVFIVTSVNGNRLIEHAREFLGTKKQIVESKDLTPKQKGILLNKIYATMFSNVSDKHMASLNEAMTTHMLSMPQGVVGYNPIKAKKHKKRKKVEGMPENFKSVGHFDEVKVTNESVEVPKAIIAAVSPITKKIAEFQGKLAVNESNEKVVYRVYKSNGDKKVLMSEGSSALSAAIDAFEVAGVGKSKSIVEISTFSNSGKQLKTTSISVPSHDKFKPLNGNLFRFEESAKSVSPSCKTKKHEWGVIVESFGDEANDTEEGSEETFEGQLYGEDYDMCEDYEPEMGDSASDEFGSDEPFDDSFDDPCDEQSQTVEDGLMNLIKSTLAQNCADCCVSLEDGSEYNVSFEENCVTVDYGDGRTDTYCITLEKNEEDMGMEV